MASTKHTVAVIGSGNVGSALGKQFAANVRPFTTKPVPHWPPGHKVIFTSRDPSKKEITDLVAQVPTSTAATVADGAAKADVVLLSVPWNSMAAFAPTLAEALAGKVVIEVGVPFVQFPLVLGTGEGNPPSAGECVQKWLPKSKVVKAFSTMGTAIMLNPNFGGVKAQTWIAGDDAAARAVVSSLAKDIGFDVVDCGPLVASRLIEATGALWCNFAFAQQLIGPGGSQGAIVLLKR